MVVPPPLGDGCKPDSVRPGLRRAWTVIYLRDYYPGDASEPGGSSAGRRPGSLFCLAPHEVFRALRFAPEAVGSYPAISPLPHDKRGAVYFLRHCLSRRTCVMTCPRFRRACCLVVSGLSSLQDCCQPHTATVRHRVHHLSAIQKCKAQTLLVLIKSTTLRSETDIFWCQRHRCATRVSHVGSTVRFVFYVLGISQRCMEPPCMATGCFFSKSNNFCLSSESKFM